MVPDLVAAVVVLLVAFFNLLLVGHAFALRNEPGMSSFGFGPLGVAGVAIAGALFRLTPMQTPITSPIASISGAVCFLGFAVDTWRLLGPARARPLLVISAAITVAVAIGITAPGIVQDFFVVSTEYLVVSVMPWGPVCFVFLGQLSIGRKSTGELRATSRLIAAAIGGAVFIAAAFTLFVASAASGDVPDPLLAIALAAECVTWVYIGRRKVSGEVSPAPLASPPRGASVRSLREAVAEAERVAVLTALRSTRGNKTEAARLLGVSYKTLFNKLHEHGIREEPSFE